MNGDRATWAAAALRQFQCMTGCDYEDSLGDLLCDLMHWADKCRFDFAEALSCSQSRVKDKSIGEPLLCLS